MDSVQKTVHKFDDDEEQDDWDEDEGWDEVVETVADGGRPHRPEWVVQISLRHAERLISEVKSKNYPVAAAWLKRAKQASELRGKRMNRRSIWER